jgi:nuclear pore complex protein Nup98-Nup96
LFGNTQQQNTTTPFGASTTNTGGGLFGNQNKPATGGLFGSNQNTNTGGSLFGNQQQQQGTTGGGLFGNTGNQPNTGTSLFGGNNQNKPAGGLFGSSTTGTAGGSLFGGNNNASGGSLFGNANQNKSAGGSLFGNTNTGGSLFGNTNTNQQNTGASLFGNTVGAGGSLFGGNQTQPQNSLFGSTVGQQQQQRSQLHASLTGAPYGNEQLFASLTSPNPPVGPLATPLQHSKPAPKKAPSLMASMRLNTPVYSPRATGSLGKSSGYGFTYSTYGTPGSAFSGSLTPGASSMLKPTGSFSSALTSRLNKSISMGNLRGDGTPSERPSLLRESALSPPGSGAGRYAGGSVRKLNIDRSLRMDLFSQSKAGAEETPKRGVSFTESSERSQARDPQPSSENALVRIETEEDEQEESPRVDRRPPRPNGVKQPEMSQINGTNGALSTVHEDGAPERRPDSAPATQQKAPPRKNSGLAKGELGDYWTEPSLQNLKNMSRQQLQHIGKFVVARDGVGRIEFGPCDLTSVPLDQICGGIVKLITRSATVYQDDASKPPMGKGLNVPSTIHLENSWPRSNGGKKAVNATEGKELDKHIARLKRVNGTKFEKYDPHTGVWTFKVDHFTTYGLDDDDEEEEYTEEVGDLSALSDPPETPGEEPDDTMQSAESEPQDDTFQFKLNQRSQMSVPGGFEEQGVTYDYDDPSADEDMDEEQDDNGELEDPFTSSGGPVRAPAAGAVEQHRSSMMEDDTGDVLMDGEEASPEMPGSFIPEPKISRSILKPTAMITSPQKLATESWEEQLQRTLSPKKRDRQALKDMQQSLLRAKEQDGPLNDPLKQSLFGRSILGQSALGESHLASKSARMGKLGASQQPVDFGKSQAFKTSMDIMNSLWADEKTGRKAAAGGKGFEV